MWALRPTGPSPSDSSQGSRPTGPHRQSESASKQVDQHIIAHKCKVTVRKVGEAVNYAARLVLTASALADALSNWFS